jgi:hypothetical protein
MAYCIFDMCAPRLYYEPAINAITCPVCRDEECDGNCCDCEECAPSDFVAKAKISELRSRIRSLIYEFEDFRDLCERDRERYNVKASAFLEKFDPRSLMKLLDGLLEFAGGAVTSDELFVIAHRFEEMDKRMGDAIRDQDEKVSLAISSINDALKEITAAETVEHSCLYEAQLVGGDLAAIDSSVHRRETARSILYAATAAAAASRRSLERRRPKRVPFYQKDIGMDAIWSAKIASALLIENALREDAERATEMTRERRKAHQAARKRGRLMRKMRDEKWSLW